MGELLTHLPRRMATADSAAVQAWWENLPEAERQALDVLWDDRNDDCAWASECGDGMHWVWRRLPIRHGRFVRRESPEDTQSRLDYFDYVLDHPGDCPVSISFRRGRPYEP